VEPTLSLAPTREVGAYASFKKLASVQILSDDKKIVLCVNGPSRGRVTGRVCEKSTQKVAQPISLSKFIHFFFRLEK
jgi:hypothetical protein